jgi:hypothetical protein
MAPTSVLAHNQHPELEGAVNHILVPAAVVMHNQHPELEGAVNHLLSPAAVMVFGAVHEITGDVAHVLANSASFVRNRHPAISGDVIAELTPVASLLYEGTQEHPLAGNTVLALGISSALVRNRHPTISGSAKLELVPAGLFDYERAVTTVTVTLLTQDGVPIQGASVSCLIDKTDTSQATGFKTPNIATGVTDVNGRCVLSMWPNLLGDQGTVYRFVATLPGTGEEILYQQAIVPGESVTLRSIATDDNYMH